MELKRYIDKIPATIKKYKHAVLVVLIGLVLMMIPTQHSGNNSATKEPLQTESITVSDELRLKEILTQISGVGEVRVMLTVLREEEIIYQMNEESSYDGDSKSIDLTTVTISDGNRNESGLIRQRIPPQYKGAIVVCGGADNPEIQYAIVDAVSKVTGLGANQISVLKMK
jgi:stage III sporulation protein AG